MKNRFMFSIVTVSYNSVNLIEQTIRSVISQDFTDYEYIIVDGSSNDGTKKIINKYIKSINKYISEPDEGIYFAMNKAIDLANGKFINFLNCGDTLNSERALSIIADSIESNTKIISCDFNIVKKKNLRQIIAKPLTIKNLKIDFISCHQAIYLENSGIKYNTKLKIRSDYLWVIENVKKLKENNIKHINLNLINYTQDGYSFNNYFLSIIELIRVQFISFGIIRVFLNCNIYLIKLLRYVKIKFILKKNFK